MRRILTSLLPLALLAALASDASAQRARNFNGMEMTPFGPMQNPVGSADYKAFVRNPMAYEAMVEAQQEQMMMKQQQQYMQAMQKQQQEYQKWAKAHPKEAAEQEKAYQAQMKKMMNPYAGRATRKKHIPKPSATASIGGSGSKKKATTDDAEAKADETKVKDDATTKAKDDPAMTKADKAAMAKPNAKKP